MSDAIEFEPVDGDRAWARVSMGGGFVRFDISLESDGDYDVRIGREDRGLTPADGRGQTPAVREVS